MRRLLRAAKFIVVLGPLCYSLPGQAAASRSATAPSSESILLESKLHQSLTVDPLFLEVKLREFTGVDSVELDGRTVRLAERNNRRNKDLALAYLKREYAALGFTSSVANYGSGINFIAEKAGRVADRVFVVAAHYDSVGTVGADDDASGVIAGLAIAQSLASLELDYSVRVVAFDQEESGLIGSRAYVNELSRTGQLPQVIGVLVLEMLGYDSDGDGAFHIIDCKSRPSSPEGNSAAITRLLMAAIEQANLPLTRTDACTTRSDHTNFWRAGKAAVVMSENFFQGDGNPCYHRRCDQVSQLDINYMGHLTSAAASAVGSLVNAPDALTVDAAL